MKSNKKTRRKTKILVPEVSPRKQNDASGDDSDSDHESDGMWTCGLSSCCTCTGDTGRDNKRFVKK